MVKTGMLTNKQNLGRDRNNVALNVTSFYRSFT